jgi:hypothetical protein
VLGDVVLGDVVLRDLVLGERHSLGDVVLKDVVLGFLFLGDVVLGGVVLLVDAEVEQDVFASHARNSRRRVVDVTARTRDVAPGGRATGRPVRAMCNGQYERWDYQVMAWTSKGATSTSNVMGSTVDRHHQGLRVSFSKELTSRSVALYKRSRPGGRSYRETTKKSSEHIPQPKSTLVTDPER